MHLPLVPEEHHAGQKSKYSESFSLNLSLGSKTSPVPSSSSTNSSKEMLMDQSCFPDGSYFTASCDLDEEDFPTTLTWSKLDQLRLQSVEILLMQSRIDHSLKVPKLQSSTKKSWNISKPNCLLVSLVGFFDVNRNPCEDPKASQTSVDHDPNQCEIKKITIAESCNLISELRSYQLLQKEGIGQGFFWIKIHDLSSLSDIASFFLLHEACVASFSDLRAHSTFCQTSNGFVMTICSFQLASRSTSGSDNIESTARGCWMRKLCICVVSHVIITYETIVYEGRGGNRQYTIHDEAAYATRDSDRVVEELLDEATLQGILSNREKYYNYGMGYLVATLVNESFHLQDRLLESCYRGLSFYRRQVRALHLHVVERRGREAPEGGIFSNEVAGSSVRQIECCLLLLQSRHMEVLGVLSEVCEQAALSSTVQGSPLHRVLSPHSLGYVEFLFGARETARYISSNMRQGLLEASHLHKDLKSIVQIRERRTGIILSLFATVFLPLTFLTGVFGMNFQLDANYSMPILNDPRGPAFFALMCLGVVWSTHIYFVANYWVEPLVNFGNCWPFKMKASRRRN